MPNIVASNFYVDVFPKVGKYMVDKPRGAPQGGS